MLREAITNQLPDVDFPSFSFMPELVRALLKREPVSSISARCCRRRARIGSRRTTPRTRSTSRKVDGKQYGMAFNASLPIGYVNADLVNKAGGDPDQMPTELAGVIDLARKIHAADGPSNGIGYSVQVWPDDWLWQAIVMQSGARILDADGTKVGFGDVRAGCPC